MSAITVKVFRQGIPIDSVDRPLRSLDGKPAVTYRKKLWPLLKGNRIEIDGVHSGVPPRAEAHAPGESREGTVIGQNLPITELNDDKQQRQIIEAPREDRLLVDAGPGTGKTAVACARVAWLIKHFHCKPNRIWLISFTRTAVREIRNRIAFHLGNEEHAWAVKIATLDSHAWAIHSGFEKDSKLFGSYDENIEKVLDLVRSNSEVAEYIEDVDHLIVDEAQDIVGIRANLVLAVVEKLTTECGVTVFTDDAQAIYGFTEDRSTTNSSDKETLSQRIRRSEINHEFEERRLSAIFRTNSPGLKKIFRDIRAAVLKPSPEPREKHGQVQSGICELADGTVPRVEKQDLASRPDVLVLYRRRVDVLIASSFLNDAGVPHRIRMSGLPVCIQPWVGATLADHLGPILTQSEFLNLWDARIADTPLDVLVKEEAWKRLVSLAGISDDLIDMSSLRSVLGRQQPPADLCNAELGDRGPIIGTIHASKGREAETVHLMMPIGDPPDTDHEEETRVVFVGATRARKHFKVGEGYKQWASKLENSGRVYSLNKRDGKARAQVQIGLNDDIAPEGIAGRRYFDSPMKVQAAQRRLLALAGKTVRASCSSDPSLKFAYALRQEDQDLPLAWFEDDLNYDLFSIGKRLNMGKRRPPGWIRNVWIIGLRSLILPPDSSLGETLHKPWSETGIMLAPLVIGYTTVSFPRFG